MKAAVIYHKTNTGLILYRREDSDALLIAVGELLVSLTPQEAGHMAAAILNSYWYDISPWPLGANT